MTAQDFPEPCFGLLEERVLLSAQPIVTVGSSTPFIGDTGSIAITFDNAAVAGTGFAPYVDVVLPKTGADGNLTSTPPQVFDGASFLSAHYLGQQLDATVIAFNANGQATHPFARDASGALRVVQASDYGAKPGDELVVLQLPFGSVVPEQPAIGIELRYALSDLADLDVPLTVSARGGFAFGNTPLNDPTADPPVLGAMAQGSITPRLLALSKTFNGPEGETATGPNFERSYALSFDVAAGQTITGAVFTDTLPAGIVLVGTPSMNVAGNVAYDPIAHRITFSPTADIVGAPGPGAEVTGTIRFYVTDVLGADGAPATLGNNLSAQFGWIPKDPRDQVKDPVTGQAVPIGFTLDPPGAEASFVAKSLATQKSVALHTDAGAQGAGPGDTLQYSINIQVSDYFEFEAMTVRDVLSDGQQFLPGTATVSVTRGGVSSGAIGFSAANLLVTGAADGRTTLDFDISGQLGPGGILAGGLFGGRSDTGTTLTVTYRTMLEFAYNSGTIVSQGDSVSNSVVVRADVRNTDGDVVFSGRDDGSASSVSIATGSVTKDVYALNGSLVTPGADIRVGVGDLVTYRVKYDLPQSVLKQLVFTDYLPLPIFDVGGMSQPFVDTVDPSVPAENRVKYGPDAAGLKALNPTVSVVAANDGANSFRISFADLAPNPTAGSTADLLFTVRVTDDPFGDGLKLTNQITAQEIKHDNTQSVFGTAIRQIILTEPELRISKGVIATDNSAGIFAPGETGPVAFNAPGTAGDRFTGVINSTNLAARRVDSDLSRVDGGDLVSFAIVVENVGSGTHGAFDVQIRDTLPAGFSIPTAGAGLNLRVTDGAGTVLPFTLGTGGFFGSGATNGLVLDDTATGALQPANPANGRNIAIVTYDLLSSDTVQPGQRMINTATLVNYAAREGGTSHIQFTQGAVQDTATVTVQAPQIVKTAIATSVADTTKAAGNPTLFDLTIGETITYEIVATLPEGRIRGFDILDLLESAPQKLNFVSASVGSLGANLFLDAAGTTPLSAPGISSSANSVTFDFVDEIYNRPDGVVSDADRITLRVTGVAVDVPGNAPGSLVTNTGQVRYTDADGIVRIVSSSVDAEIVGPSFTRTKTPSVTTVEGNDEVTYTVTFTNQANTSSTTFRGPAYDLVVTDDLLPAKLTLIAGSATLLSQPAAGATIAEAGGVVRVEMASMMPGESVSFRYTARVAPDVAAGEALPNTVDLVGDTHPVLGPDDGARPVSTSAAATVTVKIPSISKAVDSTSLPETGTGFHNAGFADLAIGEEVTYRVTVTMPEAIVTNAVVTDFLPFAAQGGFEALSASVARVGSNLDPSKSGTAVLSDSNGDGIRDRVAFDFGTVSPRAFDAATAQNQIELLVTARVRDVAAIFDGVQAVNEARLTYGTAPALSATATVDIVEPRIVTTKTVSSPVGFVKPGETVNYTIQLSHAGGSTAAAYDLTVSDLLGDPFLDIVPGSVTTSSTVATTVGTVVAGNGPGDTTLRVTVDRLLVGETRTISFQALVAASMTGGATIANQASTSFDSAPGTGGRPDGNVASATIPGQPSLTKSILSTTNPDTLSGFFDPTRPDLTIGEGVTYRIAITLPQGTTQGLVLTDLLPTGLQPLDIRIVSVGSGLATGSQALSVSGQAVSADFGTVTNSSGATVGAEDRIVVEVDARVRDLPSLVAGTVLTNAAAAAFRIGGRAGDLHAAVSADIVEPTLSIDKTATPGSVVLGDTVAYAVTLANAATATAPAYDLVVTDLLSNPAVKLKPGSVTVSAGTVALGNAPGDETIRITLPRLAPGEDLRIAFEATAVAMSFPNGVVVNTASYQSLSTPEAVPGAFIRTRSGDDSASIQLVGATPVVPDAPPLSSYQDPFRRMRYAAADLPVILAGTAAPGAAVGIEVRDAAGAPVMVPGIVADAGGHWLAPPISGSIHPVQDLEAFSALRSLAGRESAPAGETRLSNPLPAAWVPTPATAPYTVMTAETAPAFMKETFERATNVTFNGVVDSDAAMSTDPSQSPVVGRQGLGASAERPGMPAPGSLVWNSFARDFAITRHGR